MSSTGALSSAQQVLRFLLDQSEPVTRPQAALACELSRPTVFAAMGRLVELGLVTDVGQRSGLPGRSAALYEVSAEAGLVVGIDIGGSNLRVVLADVRGRVVAEDRRETAEQGGRAVLRQVVDLVRRLAKGQRHGAPSVVAVSVPGVVDADGATMRYAWNIGQPTPFDVRSPLATALRAPVVLENNVNLAAIGEQWQGAARDLQTFAVVAVGAGVGAGIVHEGRLLRGAHGAAGEVAFLPLEPGYDRMRAAAPDEAGGLILLRRAQERKGWRGGTPPTSVADLFERAAGGERLARELVEQESRRIAAITASLCAVVDPSTVILTGGVGSNQALAARTAELVQELAPFPPTVVRSDLGERASLVGALALGVRTAQESLVGRAGDGVVPQVSQRRS